MKEILKDCPSQVNFVGYCFEAGVTTSLLSAAAYYNNQEMINFLLDSKADIHTIDEIGGPIFAALKHDHKELAFSLVEQGFNISLRDCNQMTALDLLNSRPTARFDKRSKLLLKLLSEKSI